MHSPKHRPPLLLIALVVLEGCQLTEIYNLGASCPDVETFQEHAESICTRTSRTECYEKHDKSQDQLRQVDFEAAFDNDRCPDGFECNQNAKTCSLKLSDECNIDETKCAGEVLSKCEKSEDGTYSWVATEEPCNQECEIDQTKCSEGNIYRCTEDNKWSDQPFKECGAPGCTGILGTPNNPLECFECVDEETTCDRTYLKIKKCGSPAGGSGYWFEEVCKKGCIDKEVSECRDCVIGETKCDIEDGKHYIYPCKSNGKWDDDNKQPCENGCQLGENTQECYECKAGSLRCVNNEIDGSSTIQNCNKYYEWEDYKSCEHGCIEGNDIKCKECNGKPNYRNNNEGYCVIKECQGNYIYGTGTTHPDFSCNHDFTGIGECKNGTPKCVKDTLLLCIDGAWKQLGHCVSLDQCELLGEGKCYDSIVGITCNQEGTELQACSNNSPCNPETGECAQCPNDITRCKSDPTYKLLETCKEGVYVESRCDDGTHCEIKDNTAKCIQNECEIGQQRCNEDVFIQNCINYKWETTSGCPDGYSCYQSGDIAGCGCSAMSDICESSYEICQNGVCQRKSCTEDATICTRCKEGECYNSSNNLSLCENEHVKAFWWKNYGIIDRIIHIDDNNSCEVYKSLKQVINEEGTNLCNQIKTCGNPNALEDCTFQIVLNVMAGNMPNDLSDKYGGSLDIADAVRVMAFVNDDHSECNISKCETDNDCTKYQQCNTKGECVRKPCGRYPKDINICGDGYICVNDVCEEKCDIGSTRCQGNTLNTCAKGYWETEKCGAKGCKVEEGKAQCVEIDN